MTRLCRAIDASEALDTECWATDCDLTPQYRISTPHGTWDACDQHSDELLAALPTEWVAAWEPVETFPLPESDADDIPF